MPKELLADENVPKRIVLNLRKAGFLVKWIIETGERQLRNSEIASKAIATGSVVLTCDSDFLSVAGADLQVVYFEQTGDPDEMGALAEKYADRIKSLLNRGHDAILVTRKGIETR